MTELDLNDKYLFPGTAYNAGNYTMLCVNTAFIPFFRIFFSEMQEVSKWSTRDDWWRSYQVFAEIEEILMGGCVQQIIDRQDKLYRLVNEAFNGQKYTTTTDSTTGITTITPDIPVVPPNSIPIAISGQSPGLRRQLLNMQGIIDPSWFSGGNPATIADVVTSLRIGSAGKKASLLTTLGSILAAGSQAATIFSLVESLLADTIDATEEGAMVAVLIASTMAQAAMSGAQAGQLDSLLTKIDRLITSLDGGATPAPSGNILSDLDAINTKLV